VKRISTLMGATIDRWKDADDGEPPLHNPRLGTDPEYLTAMAP
jgi:hypothetical protein